MLEQGRGGGRGGMMRLPLGSEPGPSAVRAVTSVHACSSTP